MNSSWICIDASLLVRLMMGPNATKLETQLADWEKSGIQLAAPSLVHYEVSNALYQYHRLEFISKEALLLAQDAVLALPVQLFSDNSLHKKAIQLATQFNLPAAYDAHYLGLAQHLGAEFWTADKKLFKKVKLALDWVCLWSPS